MGIGPRLLLVLGLCPAAFAATDLNLSAEVGGRNAVRVKPGEIVSYAIVGELSDATSQGLAMVTFDLAFSGGPLTQADNPTANPMLNFATPLGLNNPAGFGGTVTDGTLVQVGGAQNTIANSFAPQPLGSVLTGVGLLGAPEVLATGTLTAPLQVGTYTLSIENVMANVVRAGETGVPFWAVDPAGVGTKTNLTVEVAALFSSTDKVSVSVAGANQRLTLDAGPSYANRKYLLLGTFTGSVPGITLAGGTHIPLNPSVYLNYTATNPNSPPLTSSLGTLDANGRAGALFTLPHVPASLAGLVLHHAYVLMQPIDFASNAVEVTLVP